MSEKDSNSAPSGNTVPYVSDELPTPSAECIARLPRAPLISAAVRVTRDPSNSEDIAQTALEKLLRRVSQGKLKDIRSLPGYALKSVRNLAFDNLGKRKRELGVSRLIEPPGHAADPADLVSNIQELDQQIERLPQKLKAVFILCFKHGYSAERAAAELGITISGVRKRLSRLEHFFDPVTPESKAAVTDSPIHPTRKEQK